APASASSVPTVEKCRPSTHQQPSQPRVRSSKSRASYLHQPPSCPCPPSQHCQGRTLCTHTRVSPTRIQRHSQHTCTHWTTTTQWRQLKRPWRWERICMDLPQTSWRRPWTMWRGERQPGGRNTSPLMTSFPSGGTASRSPSMPKETGEESQKGAFFRSGEQL